jgi:molybdenum cofactor cytidylyltransferase
VLVVAIVLAAGAGTRFGSAKQLAPLNGRPLLQHPLDALASAGIDDVVVVLGEDAAAIEAAIAWRGERRRVNPRPGDGLASSLRVGLDAAAEDPAAEAVLVVLGDQPSIRPDVLRAVVAAAEATDRPIVRPRYAADGAPNPVLVRREAWALAAGLDGDRGLGPLIARHPDLVHELPVEGSIPDVDTPADLAALESATTAEATR